MRELVGPYPEHPPASPPQGDIRSLVPLDVARDLFLPVAPIVFGHTTVLATAVPEAAVHEDYKARGTEHEIGAARQRLVASPAGDSVASEYCSEPKFRLLISARANSGHDFRTFFS